MSERLNEQDLDLIVYVLDVWLQANGPDSNRPHPAAQRVEDLSYKLSNYSEARLRA